ncbi:hypothetical protein Tsubulata_035924 [Turnera subulata]|uniref:F-box domain-containing protein n=1 Tax=Turnera subulata TaxID=218843 RepID=A0A9Q0J081_9ROSI|nr:hypothetical protein Tsubulata_035924 [Turnera subulata]
MAPISKNYGWSDLPIELLEKIVSCLENSYLHVLRFRAVCHSWRCSIPFPPLVPSLSLPPVVDDTLYQVEEFAVYSVQPAHHLSLTTTPLVLRILSSKPESEDGVISPRALNPPRLATKSFLDLRDYRVKEIWLDYWLSPDDGFRSPPKRVAISSSFRNIGEGFSVMVLRPGKGLALWKLEDERWTFMRNSYTLWVTEDDSVEYHNDKFYVSDCHSGRVVVLDARMNITQVTRTSWLDEKKGEWVQLQHELKERLVFVGEDSSFSIVAKHFPEYKANTLYFHDHLLNDDRAGSKSDWFSCFNFPQPPNWLQSILANDSDSFSSRFLVVEEDEGRVEVEKDKGLCIF